MDVKQMHLNELHPYENNPRKNDDAVKYVAESIKEFGFKVPIVVDKDNVIVTGHTRFKAAKKLKLKTVPVIVADDLSDEQIKAFRLADNKVSEQAEWDIDLLDVEMDEIFDIDMEDFGFDIFEDDEDDNTEETSEEDDDGYYGDERERTNNTYNLQLVDWSDMTDDFWQMPIIQNDHIIPEDIIGFNYALTNKEKNVGVHFYLDDYQFERVWNDPEKYVITLAEYDCIFSPDFSLYLDMPMSMKIWNIYRSRMIGAFYQSQGIKVIPTISWAEPETFEFCFKGIPKGSTVSISTIGVKQDKEALKIWTDGVEEMIRQIHPKTILIYGGKLDFDYGDIKTIYYRNNVTDRWQERE